MITVRSTELHTDMNIERHHQSTYSVSRLYHRVRDVRYAASMRRTFPIATLSNLNLVSGMKHGQELIEATSCTGISLQRADSEITTCDLLVSDGTFSSIDTTLRAWEPFAL